MDLIRVTPPTQQEGRVMFPKGKSYVSLDEVFRYYSSGEAKEWDHRLTIL